MQNSPNNSTDVASGGAGLDIESFRAGLAPDIKPNSFLATDYLNHFNEVVMLIGVIADMPENLEEARGGHRNLIRCISWEEDFPIRSKR